MLRRINYAKRREVELKADGKSHDEAWAIIWQETRDGIPEQETRAAKRAAK